MPSTPTLEQIRSDYTLLDSPDFEIPKGVRLVSHESFESSREVPVDYIAPGFLAKCFKWFRPLFTFFYALQLLRACDKSSVLIVNGSGSLWMYIAFCKRFFFGKNRMLFLWFIYGEYFLGTEKRLWFFPFVKFKTEWKEALARKVFEQYDLIALWSRKQTGTFAKHYRLPEEKFIFLPYKANHTKGESYEIPMNNFIFSGGNGKRNYKCLVDAVRGTDIPVIISATNPSVRKTIELLPNVIVLGASEPAFGQLQAASRICVVTMTYSGLKGGGEANFCNGMWHGKPVIGCCNIAAEDYIIDGETGYVVPSGDSEALRKRILELWNDPEKCRQMGQKGHEHVLKNFTHEIFIRRALRMVLVLGNEPRT